MAKENDVYPGPTCGTCPHPPSDAYTKFLTRYTFGMDFTARKKNRLSRKSDAEIGEFSVVPLLQRFPLSPCHIL
jgi:hypothetical protein